MPPIWPIVNPTSLSVLLKNQRITWISTFPRLPTMPHSPLGLLCHITFSWWFLTYGSSESNLSTEPRLTRFFFTSPICRPPLYILFFISFYSLGAYIKNYSVFLTCSIYNLFIDNSHIYIYIFLCFRLRCAFEISSSSSILWLSLSHYCLAPLVQSFQIVSHICRDWASVLRRSFNKYFFYIPILFALV